ncbi:SIS domain-containing protein [Thalassotalea sp. G20_0]|uniref:SIS domain-containing protein n=1 Tax=Thalassotalea sp. G20_0 TaxID=2821093 RepID=UPI001ADB2AB3|nr:SIS domain-containing protein [Thalassotalea sp. G20_0]MBO9495315.1 SIS domain-containing protein [Thalassotalea sp. G20_0]
MNLDNNMLVSDAMRNSVAGQIEALKSLEARINSSFTAALELLAECRGRAILFGVKQSGLVGQKIAATLDATGLSTHILNAAETWEDNLSMIGPGDVIIMLSYSGRTGELLRLYPAIRQMGNKVIAITGDPVGPVAEQADIVLDASVVESREDREQAPTTYTTVLLAIGDLLAETLIRRRLFSSPQAQQSDQKMVWVRDVIRRGDLATVTPDCSLTQVMQTMTNHRTNLCLVMEGDLLCGIITDGDLRRNLAGVENLKGINARNIMNGAPVCVQENISAEEARLLMKEQGVHTLVVKDRDQNVVGLLNG